MPAAVAVPLILGAGGAATSLVGAKLQSNAAKNAAKTQVQATQQAQQLQAQLVQQALAAQGQAYGQAQQLYAPYTSSAPASLSALHSFLGLPGAQAAQSAVPMGAYGPPMGQAPTGAPVGFQRPPAPPAPLSGGLQPLGSLYAGLQR